MTSLADYLVPEQPLYGLRGLEPHRGSRAERFPKGRVYRPRPVGNRRAASRPVAVVMSMSAISNPSSP
jgi:hypothetical protein